MATAGDLIRICGARTHNLRNVNLDLPRGKLIVFTGPSGSGKSSLAFDTLHAEGERRYLETLRTETRALFTQLPRPDVDLIEGLPPTLCVSQRHSRAGPRATLATLTEIHEHLRLLWARLGIPHCPQCGGAIAKHTVAQIVRATLAGEPNRKIYLLAPLVRDQPGDHKEVFQQIRKGGFLRARVDNVLMEIRDTPKLSPRKPHTIEVVVDRLVAKPGIEERLRESLETTMKQGNGRVIVTDIDDGDWHDDGYSTALECPRCQILYRDLEPRDFSFNNPHGACLRCTGFGKIWELDPELIVPDRSWSLAKVLNRLSDLLPEDQTAPTLDRRTLAALAEVFPEFESAPTLAMPLDVWPEAAFLALLNGTEQIPQFTGLRPWLMNLSTQEEEDGSLLNLTGYVVCPECSGARLNPQVRAVRFLDRSLPEATALTVDEASRFFGDALRAEHPLTPIPSPLSAGGRGAYYPAASDKIGAAILPEIVSRLRFLQEVGLGYLTLDRPASTLSGGEFQRARLANCLGGGLLGVCYILDEPTVGLHPRDTGRLLRALRQLQERGNTVIVVEHDEAVMREADMLVDIGPGAGLNGGRLLAFGTLEEVLRNPQSVTARYLVADTAGVGQSQDAPTQAASATKVLTIRGARHHNLKNIDVKIPLGRLVCLTGVSGSGKSSLARDILSYALRRHLGLVAPSPGAHDGIDGLDFVDKLIEADQKPLGRSARSTPVSYTKAFEEIRRLFAATRQAKARGYKANRFSFNVRGGRCEECQGLGVRRVMLQFLPDLTVACPVCHGARFNRPTLEVPFGGRSIADVLAMPVDKALAFFANIPHVARPLRALADVGLGYITLGQSSRTLSGGEAQRVKLAAELARPAPGHTLFLLDEPTTGLHFGDVANLVRVLRQLVEVGHSVVVIEHHMDLIAQADWVIDLGPEGGEAGGFLVVEGTPAQVAANERSLTGRFLRASRKIASLPQNSEPPAK